MARRRRKNAQGVSLFPFLSILACVIGVLTLMITALALGQMDTDAVASGLQLDYLNRQIKKSEALIERLQQELAKVEAGADDLQKQLADALVELERLKRLKESLFGKNEKPESPLEMPVVDEDQHKKRMEQIREELRQQEETKKTLLAELNQRGKPPEEAEVIIQPGGSGVDLEPTFVECTESGITVYQDDEPWRVRRADLKTDAKFLALLDQVAAQDKASVIFLVRDNALPTYYSASAVARSHYARNGKLPVIGHGKLDLSMFKK